MVDQNNGPPDARVQAFLAMLRQQPTTTDCRLCLSQLPDYVSAQQTQEDIQTTFAWTRQHLDSCVDCAEAYAQLFELALTNANSQLPQLDHIPTPDLSFLTAVPDLRTTLTQAIQQTRRRFTLQLNDLLSGLLTPSPQTALTRTTGEGRFRQKLLELTPEQLPEATLPLTLAAYADQEQPGRCLIEVTVEPPGLSWPDLGGREVNLTAGEQAHTAQTDEWGTAVFTDILIIDLDTLRLDIALEANP